MEGEFSFADMVREDEKRKVGDVDTGKEGDAGDKDWGNGNSSSYQSPKGSKTSTNFGYMGAVKDADKVNAMIPTDSAISLCPRQCWDKPNCQDVDSKAVDNLNAISTSFLPCGVSIATSSTTDYLTIKTFGVVQLRVLFSRDAAAEGAGDAKDDEAKVGRGQRHVGGNTQVQVTDINVPPPSTSAMYSPSDSYQNTSPSHNIRALNSSVTSLKTPWPCSKVEAMIMQRNSDFPCIISVGTYSSSAVRSSAASTPAGKTRPGKGF
jgi:hypothetical protein